MTIVELGKILTDMYENAVVGEKVAKAHLFAIIYADIIIKNNYKAVEIVRASNLPKSYDVEVSAGLKLSKYVVIK